MFNGTSVITHVSIWHQPTSPMISSVQMYSSFINLGQNEVTITPNQSSRLEFALTFLIRFIRWNWLVVLQDFKAFELASLLWSFAKLGTADTMTPVRGAWWSHRFGDKKMCVSRTWSIIMQGILDIVHKRCGTSKTVQTKMNSKIQLGLGLPDRTHHIFKRSNCFFLVSGFLIFFFPEWHQDFPSSESSWVGHRGSEPPLPCCHWPFDGLHGPEQGSDGCNNPGCWFMTFWISIMVFQSYEMGRKRTCHTNFPVVKSQGFPFIKAILN